MIGDGGVSRNGMANRRQRRIQKHLGPPDHESRLRGQGAGAAEAVRDTNVPTGISGRGKGISEGGAFQMNAERIAGDIGEIPADQGQEGDGHQAHHHSPSTTA